VRIRIQAISLITFPSKSKSPDAGRVPGHSLLQASCQREAINKILRTHKIDRKIGLRLRASQPEKPPRLERCAGRICALTIRSLCNIVMPFGSYRASYRWYPIPKASGSEQKSPGQRAGRSTWLRIWNRANLTDSIKCGVEPRARKKWRFSSDALNANVLIVSEPMGHFWIYTRLREACIDSRARIFASPEESLCGRSCVAPSNHTEPAKHLTVSRTDLRSNMCFITEIQSCIIVFNCWIPRIMRILVYSFVLLS